MPELILKDITRTFPTRCEPLVVLRGCSLELEAGQNAVIVGPSGSGKSTFLYIAGTLDRPTSGSVSLAGENPSRSTNRAWPPIATSELASFFKTITCFRNARCWKTCWCRRWRAATSRRN